ncbi:MAG TPA: hypothetical protein VE135_25050 [Pyrinomonadaceae bacterium]|nr:hypothetical protein [Pyrinomonadaceae bacterium]
MNCEECQPVLEEYLDRELTREVVEAVDLHLGTCLKCNAEFRRLSAELEIFQAYRPGIEVGNELWPGVLDRIRTHQTPRESLQGNRLREWVAALFGDPRLSVPVTVALIVVAVITTVVLTRRVQSPETNNTANANAVQVDSSIDNSPTSAASQNNIYSEPKSSSLRTQRARTGRYNERSVARASVSERQTSDQLVREAEKKYLSAIELLVRDVSRRHSQLDTESRVKLDQALASIDRTIAATRHVVRKHPDDPVAAQYMLAAYARKVDTLRTLATGF